MLYVGRLAQHTEKNAMCPSIWASEGPRPSQSLKCCTKIVEQEGETKVPQEANVVVLHAGPL